MAKEMHNNVEKSKFEKIWSTMLCLPLHSRLTIRPQWRHPDLVLLSPTSKPSGPSFHRSRPLLTSSGRLLCLMNLVLLSLTYKRSWLFTDTVFSLPQSTVVSPTLKPSFHHPNDLPLKHQWSGSVPSYNMSDSVVYQIRHNNDQWRIVQYCCLSDCLGWRQAI